MQELTQEQMAHVQRLAAENKMGTLNDLAEDWGVPVKTVIRHFLGCRSNGGPLERRRPGPSSESISTTLNPDQLKLIRRFAENGMADRLSDHAQRWALPVDDLRRAYDEARERLLREVAVNPELDQAGISGSAAPNQVPELAADAAGMAVLPYNWPLIQARVSRKLRVKAVAEIVGVPLSDYRRIEEGRVNPTREQASRICAYFGLALESTFAVAALPPLSARGPVSRLSVLALARARRRLNASELADEVRAATGIQIRRTTISAIERGRLLQPQDAEGRREAAALASYFGTSVEFITSQVPASAIETVTTQITAVHRALRGTMTQLGSGAAGSDPILQLDAGGGGA